MLYKHATTVGLALALLWMGGVYRIHPAARRRRDDLHATGGDLQTHSCRGPCDRYHLHQGKGP